MAEKKIQVNKNSKKSKKLGAKKTLAKAQTLSATFSTRPSI